MSGPDEALLAAALPQRLGYLDGVRIPRVEVQLFDVFLKVGEAEVEVSLEERSGFRE